MRFSVYIRRLGTHKKILKFHRSDKGLYLLSQDPFSYTSYHDDGKCWTRMAGRKMTKSVRDPLRGFSGTGTLTACYVALDDGPFPVPDPEPPRLTAEDVVLELPGRLIGIEVILSEKSVELPALPDRLNQCVYTKHTSPLLILEAFTLKGNTLSGFRFPRAPSEFYHRKMPARI